MQCLECIWEGRDALSMLAGLIASRCAPTGANTPGRLICSHDCVADGECSHGEKCCEIGCQRTCQKARVPYDFKVGAIAFVGMLLCGWTIACSAKNIK